MAPDFDPVLLPTDRPLWIALDGSIDRDLSGANQTKGCRA